MNGIDVLIKIVLCCLVTLLFLFYCTILYKDKKSPLCFCIIYFDQTKAEHTNSIQQ